jgi:hypothetical protein
MQVCPNSAKVQLNSGILARRSGNMTAALSHFQRAREIEPGYCDPGYWIGVCQLNLGGSGWATYLSMNFTGQGF